VSGGEGDDVVHGDDGADAVSGGEGDDVVHGGDGNDHVGGVGERGNDSIDGGNGDDMLEPGDGADGTKPDDDALSGGPGIDEVRYATRTTPVVVSIDGVANDGQAGEQDDVKSDVEVVTGGSAADALSGSANPETLNGGPGGDLLAGGGGDDLVMGGDGDDLLDGSAPGLPGVGKPVAGAGLTPVDNDTLDGGDGNDTLDGGPGADRMSGGPGIDTTSYALAKSPVFVTLDGKAGDGESGEGDTVGIDVENLGGSSGEDTFTGSDGVNAMSSAGGEDYMDGAAGADVMTAGGGFDVVRARDGVADNVDCGDSKDFAILDKQDTVNGSCERVDRGFVKKPKLGRLVLSRPLQGGEAFELSGMHRTVPLKDRLGLPFGSTLDATDGAVRLTAARAGGGTQTGTFSGGAFLVKQRRANRGLTDVALTGGTSLSKCNSSNSRAQAHSSAKRVLRRLFGNAHGRFRTRGRNSTATVRGTEWSVIDRCDGTLTTVKRGTVVVRDRVKHRTVTLKSGERYLARRENR
jgi:Ca2+-binding RTX toxin-like protein